MTNNTITVMKKELARFFGDRRLVITTLLLPGIMIYVVYSFLGSAMMKSILPEEAYVAKAYVVDMPESLREELRELKVDWHPADREQLTQMRQEIQDKQADGLVTWLLVQLRSVATRASVSTTQVLPYSSTSLSLSTVSVSTLSFSVMATSSICMRRLLTLTQVSWLTRLTA